MTLGETIKLLRTEQGLTQPELADKARIEQSYLSKLENDKASPSFDIINRIAQALGLTGMGLIHKLSHSYISESLSHLPEVAAEYATVKEKGERRMTRRLLMAAALLLAGTAFFLAGYLELVAGNTTFFYASNGVIKPGEHYNHFDDSGISEINESPEEVQKRLLDNRARIDRVYQQSSQFMGMSYMVDVEGGKRFFRMEADFPTPNPRNKVLEILGVLLALAGVLQAAYGLWRHRSS